MSKKPHEEIDAAEKAAASASGEVLPPIESEAENDQASEDESKTNSSVSVGQLHLHGSEIDAVRRLSSENPDLADKLIDQRDRIADMQHASYRIGIYVTAFLLCAILLWVFLFFYFFGIIKSLAAIFLLLAIAFVIVAILKGEWSETSWVGGALKSLIGILGGKRKDEDNESDC